MSEVPARRQGTGSPSSGSDSDRLLDRPAPAAAPPPESHTPSVSAEAAAAARRTVPRLWGRSTWLSLAIAIGTLAVLASTVDFDAVVREIAGCDPRLAALGGLCHYVTYQVRGVRWRRTLRHLHSHRSSWRFGLLVFFYNFVDNVVPGKLGDVYGAHLARINLGVTRAAALGSIVFVRMIDAWVVLGLAALSSSLLFADQLPDSVVWTLVLGIIIAAGASVVLLTFALTRRISPERLPHAIRNRVEAFRSGMWPRRREWASILALTLAIWVLETLWMLFLLAAFGLDLGVTEVLFLTMIPLIASAFPLTPAGAGVVELSLYGCLRGVGVAGTVAASLTVLNRLIDFWLHIALGVLTWLFRERIGLRTWREVPIELIDVDSADGAPVDADAARPAEVPPSPG